MRIQEIVTGFGKSHIGKKLSDVAIKKFRGNIVEFNTLRKIEGEDIKFRVIGFWNPDLKKYHWYLTNLECSASLIAPLYRMRWQLELLIKAAKQSINLNQIPSENEKIIVNLCIARMIALAVSMVIRKIGLLNAIKAKQESISLQRSTKVLALLAGDFINYIIEAFNESRNLLRNRIGALLGELYDPNAKKRKTSMGYIIELVGEAL